MTRFLLDTNILSDGLKPQPSPVLASWLSSQMNRDLFITVVTLAELQRGILIMPLGRRRTDLQAWFDGPAGPRTIFPGRILAFDEPAALVWARLMAEGRAAGRPRSDLDTTIASIAVSQNCVVVTANEGDFVRAETFNPFAQPL